jgi:hypothetical protein
VNALPQEACESSYASDPGKALPHELFLSDNREF